MFNPTSAPCGAIGATLKARYTQPNNQKITDPAGGTALHHTEKTMTENRRLPPGSPSPMTYFAVGAERAEAG
jgi:hypothetical protein